MIAGREKREAGGSSAESRSGLDPCPSSPNCVSSEAVDDAHRVEPFRLTGDPSRAWSAAREVVASMRRTTVVSETDTTLHAECRSFVFRFVDDLDLVLRADEGRIDVRSASRVGHSDFGVNRRRVEALRRELDARGVVAAKAD